jgi:beta-mannosidase
MFGGLPPPDPAYRASVAAEADDQLARLGSHFDRGVDRRQRSALGLGQLVRPQDFKKAGPDEQNASPRP